MNFPLACFFLIGGVILVLLYFILLFFSNHAVDKKERNSLLNSFPYLFYQNTPMSMRILLYVILGGAVVLIGLGEAFFFSAMEFTYYQFALSLLFPLALLCLYISNLLPLNYYRSHLVFSVLGFFLFASASVLTGLIPFVTGATLEIVYYNKTIVILIGVIGLLCFLGLCNPKLANWSKMQRAEDNGKTYYVKPKINFYAFYEWMSLILMAVVALLLFINILVLGLIVMN